MPKYQVTQGDKLPPKRTGSLLNSVTNSINQLTIPAPANPLTPPGAANAPQGQPSQPQLPKMRAAAPGNIRPRGPAMPGAAAAPAVRRPAPAATARPGAARVNIPQQRPQDIAAGRAMTQQPTNPPGTAAAPQTPAPAQGTQASVINIFTAPGAQK